MPRLAGVDIPENKRVEASLQYIYGVGRINVRGILEKAKVDGNKRTNQLALEELSRLQKVLDEVKETGSYRGIRHARGLPARGQRTRTNARTKRGKRMTIGALKKEALAKVEASKVEKAKKEEKK